MHDQIKPLLKASKRLLVTLRMELLSASADNPSVHFSVPADNRHPELIRLYVRFLAATSTHISCTKQAIAT